MVLTQARGVEDQLITGIFAFVPPLGPLGTSFESVISTSGLVGLPVRTGTASRGPGSGRKPPRLLLMVDTGSQYKDCTGTCAMHCRPRRHILDDSLNMNSIPTLADNPLRFWLW